MLVTCASMIIALRTEQDRKAARRALEESERHFRELANSKSALIWTSDADGGCNYFNDTWLQFTGRTLEQSQGTGWVADVHADDLEGCLDTWQRAFARREPFRMEYRLRHAAGGYRWISDEGNPRRDADGAFVGYIGYCYDITERKRGDLALDALAARYARLSGEGFYEAVCRHIVEALDLDIAFVGQLCADGAHDRGARGLGRGRSDRAVPLCPCRLPLRWHDRAGRLHLPAGGACALSARPRTRAHGHRGLRRHAAVRSRWRRPRPHCRAASPPLRRRGGGTHPAGDLRRPRRGRAGARARGARAERTDRLRAPGRADLVRSDPRLAGRARPSSPSGARRTWALRRGGSRLRVPGVRGRFPARQHPRVVRRGRRAADPQAAGLALRRLAALPAHDQAARDRRLPQRRRAAGRGRGRPRAARGAVDPFGAWRADGRGRPGARRHRARRGAQRAHLDRRGQDPDDPGGQCRSGGVIERKRAHDGLQASEARYRSVVESVREVIFQLDGRGRWTFLNKAWADITGYALADTSAATSSPTCTRTIATSTAR